MFEEITSASNPLVKTLRGLDRKKVRTETGLFLAEGARLVEQGLDRGWTPRALLASRAGAERPYMRALLAKAGSAGARVALTSDRLLGQISRKDNPQTVIGAFEQRRPTLDALAGAPKGIWLALYEPRDPGNLGTILRTADCAGVNGVALLGTTCDPYSIEAVRATMGSIFDVPFAEASFAAFDVWRRRAGLSLTAASVNGSARHDDVPYGERAGILMGNEQSGLPREVEAACDSLAWIPMRGGADSLNLAQATAVMIYEAWRSQGFSGIGVGAAK